MLPAYNDRPNDRPGHFSPMKLRIGDRFTDADTEDADHEWGRGLAAGHLQAGHEVRARVERPGDPGTAREKYWAAHEKITVRRKALADQTRFR